MTPEEKQELKDLVLEAVEGMDQTQQAAAWGYIQGMQAAAQMQETPRRGRDAEKAS